MPTTDDKNPDKTDEMVSNHLKNLVPIDNFPRNYNEERNIANEQRASLFLFSKLGSAAFKDFLPIGLCKREREAVYHELTGKTRDNIQCLKTPAWLFQVCSAYPTCRAKTPDGVFNFFRESFSPFGNLSGFSHDNFGRFPSGSPANLMQRLAFDTVLMSWKNRFSGLISQLF